MNTYTGGAPSNKQNGESAEKANAEEDLFLSGGFDSFGGAPEPMNTGMGQMGVGMGQANAGMGQLGSVDYGIYGTGDNSTTGTNRWSQPKVILNLWGQLFNSFVPFRYDRYKGMSMGAAKDFVKFFIKLYLIAGFLATAIMMLMVPGAMEYFKSGDISILLIIIVFGVTYAICAFIGPYFFRLQALIYRVIFGNLLMAIEKKKVNSTNMYLISVYSCVPCMALGLPLGIVELVFLNSPSMVPFVAGVAVIYAVLELVMPIIIMALAIPRME